MIVEESGRCDVVVEAPVCEGCGGNGDQTDKDEQAVIFVSLDVNGWLQILLTFAMDEEQMGYVLSRMIELLREL